MIDRAVHLPPRGDGRPQNGSVMAVYASQQRFVRHKAPSAIGGVWNWSSPRSDFERPKEGSLLNSSSYRFENPIKRTRKEKENRDPLGTLVRMLPKISGTIVRM